MSVPRGENIAKIALAHVGCSAEDDVEKYRDLIFRPSDPPSASGYYVQNHRLSTCALAVLGCWRLAGCLEPECVDAYVPGGGSPGRIGKAFSDVQALALRAGAWTAGRAAPLKAGDVWVIVDASGREGHMGICVADQVAGSNSSSSSSSNILITVEGGQLDSRGGSTAIKSFSRTLVQDAASGRWRMGNMYFFGVAHAALLPIPDVNSVAPDA